MPRSLGAIKHVVILIQENRSFDNLFQGYPGADTVSSGQTSTGQSVPLQPIPIHVGFDVAHGLGDFLNSCDGGSQGVTCKMDGFDRERVVGRTPFTLPMYSYVPAADTALYVQLAQQYVLADENFQSHLDASFVGHQYLIAGQAHRAVNLPHGVWGCPAKVSTLNDDRTVGPNERACFDEPTIASEIDARGGGLTWRMYAPRGRDPGNNWIAFRAIKRVYYGREWGTNIRRPSSTLLSDIGRGFLPSVSWVVPSFVESDHEGAANRMGEEWVSTVVNAIGQSAFWNSTAIFVVWDDWGGFYDHVPPVYLDYDGLGFRTPLLVISPYAKANYVSHTQYEYGSVLQFVEDVFGLRRLAASDTRANSLIPDCFNPSQKARAFKSLPTTMRPTDFVRADEEQPAAAIEADGD